MERPHESLTTTWRLSSFIFHETNEWNEVPRPRPGLYVLPHTLTMVTSIFPTTVLFLFLLLLFYSFLYTVLVSALSTSFTFLRFYVVCVRIFCFPSRSSSCPMAYHFCSVLLQRVTLTHSPIPTSHLPSPISSLSSLDPIASQLQVL